jgi:photosystem II stability/assembly factor-like uncharacterized protein
MASLGPPGTGVRAIAIDATKNPGRIYLGTNGAGVRRSVDGGQTWSDASTGLDSQTICSSLVIDPSDSNIIYAGTVNPGGVFKSTDGGDTWSTTGVSVIAVLSLAISPADPGTVYAGTSQNGLSKTTDGGKTWSPTTLQAVGLFSLAVDPISSNTVYAASADGDGVFKSFDAGTNWSEVSDGLIDRQIWSVVVDPLNPGMIYLGTRSGVFKSTDGARTWSQTTLNDQTVFSVRLDPSDSTTLYAATVGAGIFKSSDGGDSWSAVNDGLTHQLFLSLAIDPSEPQTVFAGTVSGEGVFATLNGGEHWSELTTGLAECPCHSLRLGTMSIDPSNSNTMYVAVQGDGVFKSGDAGASWADAAPGFTNPNAITLTVDPEDPNTILAGLSAGGGVLKSTDGGNSWFEPETPFPGDLIVWGLAIDPADSTVVYAALGFHGVGEVRKSCDGGDHWSTLVRLPVSRIASIAVDPSNTQNVYVGTTGGGIYKSADAGTSWSQVNDGLTTLNMSRALRIDPNSEGVMYAGSVNGVFKSNDSGVLGACQSDRSIPGHRSRRLEHRLRGNVCRQRTDGPLPE